MGKYCPKAIFSLILIHLILNNILILCLIKEFGIKALIFFINNLYLLYFTFNQYKQEVKEKNNIEENNLGFSFVWDKFTEK